MGPSYPQPLSSPSSATMCVWSLVLQQGLPSTVLWVVSRVVSAWDSGACTLRGGF